MNMVFGIYFSVIAYIFSFFSCVHASIYASAVIHSVPVHEFVDMITPYKLITSIQLHEQDGTIHIDYTDGFISERMLGLMCVLERYWKKQEEIQCICFGEGISYVDLLDIEQKQIQERGYIHHEYQYMLRYRVDDMCGLPIQQNIHVPPEDICRVIVENKNGEYMLSFLDHNFTQAHILRIYCCCDGLFYPVKYTRHVRDADDVYVKK